MRPHPDAPEPPSADRPVLEVRGLRTQVATPTGPKVVVDGLDLTLAPGEVLCIAGESGSGKSMAALSIMGLLPRPMARIAAGSIRLNGRELTGLGEARMRAVRGAEISMIFQEPMTSLNPVLTIGRQVGEAIEAHRSVGRADLTRLTVAALEAVRIPEAARRLKQYPHELSGGMRQRVMIAMAMACGPKVLIADEPTTALDVTIQAQILELMRDLRRDHGTAVILITHDMGVVAEMADRVVIMNQGRLVEDGPVLDVFERPRAAYTRTLLAAVPRLGAYADIDGPVRSAGRSGAAPAPDPARRPRPVAEVRDLTVRFDLTGGLLQRVVRRVHAVEGVSFDLFPGETLALVGESGCGKSTTGKALMNLIPWTGAITIDGTATHGLGRRAMRPVRRHIQMVFQDPFASLDPRMTVGDLVAEPMRIHGLARGRELDDRVAELFRRVRLEPDVRDRYPHEFSGGQRQRICIARALGLSPRLIVADESVSALDVSVQAQVLDLMQELQAEMGLSYLFISHDMAVVEQVSHRVAVMYMGRIVEIGRRRDVFGDPRHPYTRKLLTAVPRPDPRDRRDHFRRLEGEIPSPVQALDYRPPPQRFDEVRPGHIVDLSGAPEQAGG
ncbi:ABC transporter ATP-binding protein [Roseospira navarrensis]|uniref:Dipeptide ABC transporter ATP-binding protein n=1 Tax=Roseospira navarrensis TaxID=140058 RepID=A0A7X1ZD34_9PROT|nr:ABC transporter ATP-binding protein [Roseospira navarrensis]MQX36341.1 dipeptide ABC transporter ATP-binding protein [Roseospira navarrensis]